MLAISESRALGKKSRPPEVGCLLCKCGCYGAVFILYRVYLWPFSGDSFDVVNVHLICMHAAR